MKSTVCANFVISVVLMLGLVALSYLYVSRWAQERPFISIYQTVEVALAPSSPSTPRCRLVRGKNRCLPTAMLLGASKAGTTSMANLLKVCEQSLLVRVCLASRWCRAGPPNNPLPPSCSVLCPMSKAHPSVALLKRPRQARDKRLPGKEQLEIHRFDRSKYVYVPDFYFECRDHAPLHAIQRPLPAYN
jgi:hypothetical protein